MLADQGSLTQQLASSFAHVDSCAPYADATADNRTDIIEALSCWPHMASGSGREASVYLQYIVDEYDQGLADTTVFIHGHE